ncbi:penicillin-binding transpeptidase domain-containing protein [Streptomyces sp. H27-D2]|uniref:penicillin-binding transpeptidase domain-containing protein n=1 Tax=Streptomyces sp. H27-D2 TaxID=3046304 RepID=UPI002DB6BDEC|nr:penicillin-binding transpeptidase domain-containing protein [Streptomyces sp. H27-D2]MEC4015234.1 penicillin-binding transpeptidase domain-containing protein [Streptomyces sp. H27-D2]
MRREVKTGLIVGVCAALIGVAGCSSTDDQDSDVRTDNAPSKVKTGPLSAAEVRTTTRDFLTAWAAGDVKKAAALTDDPKAAAAALTGYRKDAHVTKVTLKGGKRAGVKVPFNATARISYKQQSTTLAYASVLSTVRDKAAGHPLVAWQPSVLHPELKAGDKLLTGESGAPPIKAVDRDGAELRKEDHPTLTGVLASLRDRYGKKAGGKAGVEVTIHRAKVKNAEVKDGKAAEQPDKTLKVLSQGTPGTLRTTLDGALQRAAEQSVNKRPRASAVAVKPSTGEILAIANSPATGFNGALQGSMAPGSTMKVVTAATLLDRGLAGVNKPHPCPKYSTYGGWKFQNDKKFEIKGGTFAQSFMRSCNTAFITQAPKLPDDALTKEASEVFGLGLNWQTGVPTFDGAVPVQSDAQKAASLIGQGGVRMNPLNMASVAATASSGTFRQPVLVAPSLDNRTLAKASRSMKPTTVKQLRELMRLTATAGTGAEAMAGVSGNIGAKTGSAEVDGQKKPNGWFTAYRGDLAAAAVVPASGHGGENAGPVVRAMLTAG